MGHWLGSRGNKQERKRTHGHRQQCVTAGVRGVSGGGREYKGDKW